MEGLMQSGGIRGVLEVAERIWRIAVPLPNSMGPTEANVYVIEDAGGAVHLMDTGWDTDEGRGALLQGLSRIGYLADNIRSITVTHMHRDHRGLAEDLRRMSGARVAMHEYDMTGQHMSRGVDENELEKWGVPAGPRSALRDATPLPQPPTTIDRKLVDGDVLEIPGRVATVVHTPGHTTGSICIALPAERIVITGDHVLPNQFPGLGLGGPPLCGSSHLQDYVRSLDRLMVMDGWVALPGHGDPVPNLKERIGEIRRHHAARTLEAHGLRIQRPHASVWETAQSLTWGAGWDGLSAWHRVSALRQTEMHLAASDATTQSLYAGD